MTFVPQIFEHICKSQCMTIYGCRWIPKSAKFVIVGENPNTTGCIKIYELDENDLKLIYEGKYKESIRCGTLGASSIADKLLATGSFKGKLEVWDLHDPKTPVWSTQAHTSIINAIDGIGGKSNKNGPPEIVTCSRDGCVRVWDIRCKEAPVSAFEGSKDKESRDCWSVSFGNSYNNSERCVLAGYDNGDLKMFDLKMNKIRWETHLQNGICSVQFDRVDIEMNKIIVTCLESTFYLFDLRTQHPEKGFSHKEIKVKQNSTIWGCHHLPQNRDIFMIACGDGTLLLYNYKYPNQRRIKDIDGKDMGVCGDIEELSSKEISTLPVCCFDWNSDKEGLFISGSFDQCIRVGIVTGTNKI